MDNTWTGDHHSYFFGGNVKKKQTKWADKDKLSTRARKKVNRLKDELAERLANKDRGDPLASD